MVTGALVLVFGRGLAAHFSSGTASRAGPVLVEVIGASLIASGLFATDPSAMVGQTGVHGLAHGIVGARFKTSWDIWRQDGNGQPTAQAISPRLAGGLPPRCG